MYKKFKGTGVAIVTPFRKDRSIDFSSLGKIIEHTIINGIDYIVSLGTTGESATLSNDEKNAVIDYTVEIIDKRVPLVVGFGGNNTQEVINCIRSANFNDIDAILSVCPYYNKPQQKGVFYHYKSIANASPVPVIMYNIPGRSSINMLPETTLKLATEVENIIGIKEASGNMGQCMEIVKNKPKDFLLLSGEDALTLPMLSFGCEGVISVVANAFPGNYSDMVNSALKGNYKKAKELHYKLLDIINALFADGNPSGVKAALEILGLCTNNVRLPLVKVNKAVYNQLNSLIQNIKLQN